MGANARVPFLFSPNSVVTPEFLKVGCLIGDNGIRVWLSRGYVRYVRASQDLRSAFRLRKLAETTGPLRALSSM